MLGGPPSSGLSFSAQKSTEVTTGPPAFPFRLPYAQFFLQLCRVLPYNQFTKILSLSQSLNYCLHSQEILITDFLEAVNNKASWLDSI